MSAQATQVAAAASGDLVRYRQVVAVRRGGPEALVVREAPLRLPRDGEVRLKVLTAPVSLPDVQARQGLGPLPPRVPFVPGYAVIASIEALGSRVSGHLLGERVAALTIYGGYSEFVYVPAAELIPLPAGLEPVAAATLVLNYLVAYQCLHRVARVKAGDKVLVVGASGGIGTAFLQLGSVAGLKVYGLASKGKHAVLLEHGATPIDYRSEDFVSVIRTAEPDGLDAVFDGVGGDYLERGLSVLRTGGTLVSLGNPLSLRGLARLLARMIRTNLTPGGKRVKLYGTTLSKLNRRPFLEDWATLFQLLAEGRIEPVIEATFPLLEAAAANRLLESGQVVGNLVLAAPELLEGSARLREQGR